MIRSRGFPIQQAGLTVHAPVSRADRGDAAGGHDELLHGLERAEAARDDGDGWGEELVEHWQRVVERYARVYRIGRA